MFLLTVVLLIAAASSVESHTCWARGDPHYETYDGKKYGFQGTCTYVLSKYDSRHGPLTHFKVFGDNEPSPGLGPNDPKTSYTKEVIINVFEYTIKLQDYGKVIVNGDDRTKEIETASASTSGKYRLGNLVIIIRVPHSSLAIVIVTGNYGHIPIPFLKVTFDSRGPTGRHTVSITLFTRDYNGKVVGLCGNHNGDPDDDLKPNATALYNTWKTDKHCKH